MLLIACSGGDVKAFSTARYFRVFAFRGPLSGCARHEPLLALFRRHQDIRPVPRAQ